LPGGYLARGSIAARSAQIEREIGRVEASRSWRSRSDQRRWLAEGNRCDECSDWEIFRSDFQWVSPVGEKGRLELDWTAGSVLLGTAEVIQARATANWIGMILLEVTKWPFVFCCFFCARTAFFFYFDFLINI
jgi:hypothetical protein